MPERAPAPQSPRRSEVPRAPGQQRAPHPSRQLRPQPLSPGQLRSHRRGHGPGGTTANAPGERQPPPLGFSRAGGELCPCPGTAGPAEVPSAGRSPLMLSCHLRSESMWGRGSWLPWEKGLSGDSHC